MCGASEVVQIFPFARLNVVIVEQAAVEPFDLFEPDKPAILHRAEQRLGMGGKTGRVRSRSFYNPFEHLVRQELHILGKHAEHQTVDEMRHFLRVVSSFPKALVKIGKVLSHLFCDQLAGLGRFEDLWI